MRKQPLSPTEFESIYSKVPRLCVDLLIQSEKGILLILRKKHGWVGQWHLPGGTVLYREAISDTAVRLAREEVGTEIKIEKLLGYVEFPSEVHERGYGYSVSLVLLCRPERDDFPLTDGEREMGWFKSWPEKMVTEQKEFLESMGFFQGMV